MSTRPRLSPPEATVRTPALLIIGGGEDRCCGTGVLERFVGLCGGTRARITLVTTAAGVPDEVHAEYEPVLLTYE